MSDIFRSDAVKKLRDPQQLDTAIRLTSPSGWLALAAMALIVVVFLVWVFVGALPFQSNGLGVLLQRNTELFEVPAPSSGLVAAVDVRTGDEVKKGQRIALIDVPETEAQYKAAQRTLASLKQERQQRQVQTDNEVARQRKITGDSIAAQQSKIADLQGQLGYLTDRKAGEEQELARGFITRDTLEQTIQSIASVQQQIRSAQVEISSLRATQAAKEQDVRRELSQLDQQILQAENSLAEVATQRDIQHVVTAPIDGIVEEVAASVGDTTNSGESMFTVAPKGEGLQMFAYLPISKGKRVTPGMVAKVTPSTVERDIYGSVAGKVVSVSELPASRAELKDKILDDALVDTMLSNGAPIQIVIDLESDPKTYSGLNWATSEGPQVRISPGTTATATITVRDVRPIDLFIPIVETWVTGR